MSEKRDDRQGMSNQQPCCGHAETEGWCFAPVHHAPDGEEPMTLADAIEQHDHEHGGECPERICWCRTARGELAWEGK